MRPLLIGQAPGPRTNPDLPLFPVPGTSAGGRLQQMMGMTRGEYLNYFQRMNLLPYFPGKHKRDDKFPMSPAKLAAAVVKPLLAGRTVILVGRNVANAFGLEADFHDWVDWPVIRYGPFSRNHTANIAIIPHPSGRNHWYNSPENRGLSKVFWDDFLDPDLMEKRVLPFVCGGTK